MKKISSLIFAGLLQACSPKPHDKSEIEMAMREYDRRLITMNADSIALLYDEEGELGDIAHGRDSIRNFLRTFANVRVLSSASTTEAIEMMDGSAKHTGSYVQTDVIDNKDTITVRGTFTGLWKWNEGEGWRIKRMDTKPL